MLQLSELGAIHMMHLKFSDDTQDPIEELMIQKWSDEVEELNEQVQSSETKVGPLGARTFMEADLRPAYESKRTACFLGFDSSNVVEIFMNPTTIKESDAVYDLLEKMPRFWQEAEGPVEHVLTTYVITRFLRPFSDAVLSTALTSRIDLVQSHPTHRGTTSSPRACSTQNVDIGR